MRMLQPVYLCLMQCHQDSLIDRVRMSSRTFSLFEGFPLAQVIDHNIDRHSDSGDRQQHVNNVRELIRSKHMETLAFSSMKRDLVNAVQPSVSELH